MTELLALLTSILTITLRAGTSLIYATIGEICDVFRDVFGEYKGLHF